MSYSFSAKSIFTTTIILAAAVISLAGALFYQGNRILVKEMPTIEAAEEIKVNGAMAHVWFEEVLSGDTTQSIKEVWYFLDLADWYALALLEGGESIRGRFKPIQDEQLRNIVVSMRETLVDFRHYDTIRYAQQSTSTPGSEVDILSDAIFLDFIQQADDLKRQIKLHVERSVAQYQYISLSLIVAAVIIASFINFHLFRIESNKRKLYLSLKKANTDIEAKNQELHQKAHFDTLTRLPNRTLFKDRLNQSIINSERLNLAFSLLFIDLDHFKAVNDEYGHEAGDKLLREVAKRITRRIRVSDTCARISGDEFVVILSHQKSVEEASQSARHIANNLITALESPFVFDDFTAHISASIGVSVFPTDGHDHESLVRYADNAMYHAKSLGKNNVQFYSEELNQRSLLQRDNERALQVAIANDQFVLHYLPIWHMKDQRILGVEVLTRWQHPKKGLLYPDHFIPLAESCSHIDKLDLLIIEKSLKQCQSWHQQGINLGKVCINISANSLKKRHFFEQLKSILRDFPLPAHTIELEITETALLENDQYAQEIFNALKEIGVGVALDDFGTGYSSLLYLKKFEFDTLKIDRSFVSELTENRTSTLLLKNILQIGRDLDLAVIAEGVETELQQNALVSLGFEIGQGFLLTPPVDANTLVGKLNLTERSNVISLLN
ncbi:MULTISPECIES: bifunctional diguanylate cyclase/phosphodiesterase [unclassified Vibrio]|uniref:EAL domain-containing protein n=1 Tax=Vibrio sp. HB236076 TaxID=3232307 RepID=A0AB39HHM6_9VIBR|nr:EAL domain-containing protein [Vibrio sp. HB161653]MDP5254980.1 EAL domain-containing protein [Vibrio sp. HB161653]